MQNQNLLNSHLTISINCNSENRCTRLRRDKLKFFHVRSYCSSSLHLLWSRTVSKCVKSSATKHVWMSGKWEPLNISDARKNRLNLKSSSRILINKYSTDHKTFCNNISLISIIIMMSHTSCRSWELLIFYNWILLDPHKVVLQQRDILNRWKDWFALTTYVIKSTHRFGGAWTIFLETPKSNEQATIFGNSGSFATN